MYRIGEDLDALASRTIPAPDTPRRPESRNISNRSSISRIEEKQCRICFDGPTSSMPLISPCRCAGSVKFVHEECLKTWLISQQTELDESECEVCKVKFEMRFIIMSKCAPREACKTGFAQLLFLPLLAVVLAMLMLIIYILVDRLANVVKTGEERGYTIALIVVCLLSAGVIMVLIVNSLKESMCVKKMDKWHIRSQYFPEEHRNTTEAPMKEDSVNAVDNTTHYGESTRPLGDPTANQQISHPGIVVVPEITRVRGQRVRTPTLSPGLASIHSANPRIQVFAFSGSRSVSGNSTPLQPNFPESPQYTGINLKTILKEPDFTEHHSFREDY